MASLFAEAVLLLAAVRLVGNGHLDQVGLEQGYDIPLEKADGSAAGVEVKASATVSAAEFTALQALRDQPYGKPGRFGPRKFLLFHAYR